MRYRSFMGRNEGADAYSDPVVEAYKRDVDRTLIRENLRLSVEERLERLIALQQCAHELRRASQAPKPR
jgi:hypothetical protein